MFFFVEHVTGYPFISFHPDKSTDSFLKGLEALVARARKLSTNKIRLLKGDFDTAWAVQGRPDFILTGKVQAACAALNIDFTPVAPYSQSMNKAEPIIKQLNAFAFANAIRASLNFRLVWADMFRGAASQYACGLIDTAKGRMTRYTAATGKLFDASTFGGSPGQLAWIMREGGKASAGIPRAESGIYVCPDASGVNGSWIRLWGSGTLLLTNKYHVAQDTHIRSLLACVAQEAHPRGAILDPNPEGYSNGLA